MKTYKVITTCTFQNRYLEKDKIVEYADDVSVPRHLELVKGSVDKPKTVDKADTFSGMQEKNLSGLNPQSGFGKGLVQEPKKSEPEKSEKKKG